MLLDLDDTIVDDTNAVDSCWEEALPTLKMIVGLGDDETSVDFALAGYL